MSSKKYIPLKAVSTENHDIELYMTVRNVAFYLKTIRCHFNEMNLNYVNLNPLFF
jgi:hypothetical protein